MSVVVVYQSHATVAMTLCLPTHYTCLSYDIAQPIIVFTEIKLLSVLEKFSLLSIEKLKMAACLVDKQ